MSVDAGPRSVHDAPVLSLGHLPALLRDPLKAFAAIGREAGGRIARVNLGPFRPYLITHPEHLQYVLRDHVANYRREGMMWKPLSRLTGEGSDVDPSWPVKRKVFQTLLSGPSIAAFSDEMTATIAEAVDDLGARAEHGGPVDAFAEMTRVVYRTIIRVLVGDRISLSEIDELGRVMVTATTSSFRSRMLMPFMPLSIPLPGDRAFNRCVQAVDDLILPIVREARRTGADGQDVVSMMIRARDGEGRGVDDQAVRDGIVGLFVASTDTTVSALSFIWAALDAHPEIRARLYDEIDTVVGTDTPGFDHVPDLVYTKKLLHEVLRWYSVAWITPRTVRADDVIDGVRIRAGSTVIISPFLTHRLPEFWPEPEVFDPERFAPDVSRHRFAYMAFGGGPNQCAGRVFFFLEAPLILATLLSRFRPVLQNTAPVEPRVDITLKPREPIRIRLVPVKR
ncbi:cytochrome P450 [Actinomadura sp. KC216]|uniref:cytochrome P450 n=1 Tax=Actinomadura sp. KC216 TaxID=2530370 RepID=UPI001042F86D|nr:cytochrome P450 [Actinomadura sp. KC216]TDB91778.1 cytochrome P450 [Actinomadura sp. KC216]